MELSSSILKYFLYFLIFQEMETPKEKFLISQETENLKKLLIFQKWNPALSSPSSKNEKNPPRENFLYFRKP